MLRLKSGSIDSLDDLRSALQSAVQLEHATIPPYLTAFFTISGTNAGALFAAQTLHDIFMEEMLHMVLVANVLNARPWVAPFGRASTLLASQRASWVASVQSLGQFLGVSEVGPAHAPGSRTGPRRRVALREKSGKRVRHCSSTTPSVASDTTVVSSRASFCLMSSRVVGLSLSA